MIFSAPKFFDHNRIEEFLKSSEVIFSLQNKLLPGVYVDLSKLEDISILGLLLIYKFIDYTYQNLCFKKPQLITSHGANDRKVIEQAWKRYEFDALIQRYISNKDITEQAYKNFKIKIEDNFIIAPQPLLRSADFSKETLRNDFIPKLNTYYNNDEKTVLMLFTCLSEILLNFWEHAVDDNRSIIIADGTKKKIEIACADTGEGIITSLKTNPKYSNMHDSKILSKALDIGATSKERTNHMGYGLWIINEITNLVRGKLYIYSEGYFFKNDHGKVKSGSCAFWKGTIVYLNLPLGNPVSFSDLESKVKSFKRLTDIKINFI